MNPTPPKPFYSHVAECGVIGSILLGGDCEEINSAIPYGSGAFFDNRCRVLYATIGKMRGDRKHVDLVTLIEELKETGWLSEAGGPEFVSSIVDSSPSASNGTYYAKIVSEKYALRQMYNLVVTLKNKLGSAGEQDIEDVVSQFERGASEIRGLLTRPTGDVDNKAVLRELVDLYQGASEGRRPYFVPTGFPDLDRISGGMRPGELFVIGARPGIGKSTVSLNIAENAASKGFQSGVFSLEMKGQELLARMVASESKVCSKAAEEGATTEMDNVKMAKAFGFVNRLPVLINDKSGIRIEEIAVHTAGWVKKRGVKLVVIDYLQLIDRPHGDPVEGLSVITRKAKVMAMDLNIPVILISQLNRSSEKENRMPMLSDLRSSGSIEQDANFVWLLWQPNPQEDIVRLLQAKARRGPIGTVEFLFNKRCNRFESVERRVSE
jgi:replicative DNA helicase